MRNTILLATAAAFTLSLAGSAYAAPSFSQVKKDDEIKNPAASDRALTKTESKDAKKNAHVAENKAKRAEHKAKVAANKAKAAAKDASASQ